MARLLGITLAFLVCAWSEEHCSDRSYEPFASSLGAEVVELDAECARSTCFKQGPLPLHPAGGNSNLLQVASKRSPAVEMSEGNATRGPKQESSSAAQRINQYLAADVTSRSFLSRLRSARSRVAHVVLALGFLVGLAIVCWLLPFRVETDKQGDSSRLISPRHGSTAAPHPSQAPSAASLGASGPLSSFIPSLRQTGSPPQTHVSPRASYARYSPTSSFVPASSSQSVVPAKSQNLCPGLVVPSGNECHLAVPVLSWPIDSTQEAVAFDVQDLEGKSVVRAEVVLPVSGRFGLELTHRKIFGLKAIAKSGREAGREMAYCKATHEAGSGKRVCIYDPRDELFAIITRESANSRYVLSGGRTNRKIFIDGNPATQVMNFRNEQMQLLAETSPESMPFNPTKAYYKLRVASEIDVGLILCALFSVYRLELA